jgi:hypothetical protein
VEQNNRRLSEANDVVKRDIRAAVAEGSAKVKQDLTNLKQELAELKEEMRATTPQPESLAPPAADAAVPPAPEVISPPPKPGKQFRPSVKKGRGKVILGTHVEINILDGIIAHMTRECGGNVHDRLVVEVTSGSFEKETHAAGLFVDAMDAADLNAASDFCSAYRDKHEDIPHTKNNWVCYDFNKRSMLPTHYT